MNRMMVYVRLTGIGRPCSHFHGADAKVEMCLSVIILCTIDQLYLVYEIYFSIYMSVWHFVFDGSLLNDNFSFGLFFLANVQLHLVYGRIVKCICLSEIYHLAMALF